MSKFTDIFLSSNSLHPESELNDENKPPHELLNSMNNENNDMLKENNDMLKEILKNTVKIKKSMKDLTTRIEKLEESNQKMHSRQLTELTMTQKWMKPKKETQILKSPFNSVDEFEKLEGKLKTSSELCEKLEDEIFKHPGADPSKFVRSIWRKILNDNVASKYSWKGTQNKRAIVIMAIKNAFRGAFNRKFVGYDKEFNRASAKWFQTSKERYTKKENK